MRVLLDTCALIWFLRNDSELSETAAAVVENPDTEPLVSVVSIWEIAIKAGLGKIKPPAGLEGPLETKLLESGFQILPVEYSHAAGVYSLPRIHNDPFDRLLISQCRTEKLAAVTNDEHWSDPRYGIRVVW